MNSVTCGVKSELTDLAVMQAKAQFASNIYMKSSCGQATSQQNDDHHAQSVTAGQWLSQKIRQPSQYHPG